MKRLEPKEELEHLKDIYGSESVPELYSHLRVGFSTLQSRSHVLLSLVTICLTITGFSGPSIAASGVVSKIGMVAGLCFVLSAAGCLLVGAFDLQWITRYQGNGIDDTLIQLLERRNRRTRTYRFAMLLLVSGLTSYVGSIVVYMLGTV
jgi:hypothetical protein